MFAIRNCLKLNLPFRNVPVSGRRMLTLSSSLLRQNFSTKNRLYGCQKARDNYEELVITMKKNIDTIQKSFKGKDYNYLQNSLNNLINIGLRDHQVTEEIIKEMKDHNLHLEIQESSQIEKLLFDLLNLLENPKYRKIGMQMIEEMSQNFLFLKLNQLQRIERFILNSPDKFIRTLLTVSPKLKTNIQKYQNITNQELQKEIFAKLAIQESSKNYKITSFNADSSQFTLYDEANKQEIIIQGVDNTPSDSYDTFKQIFKEKQGAINLLIVQDQPIADSDSVNPEQMNDEYYVDEINQMYKSMKDIHELYGFQLRQFLINCFNDESFKYDFDQNKFKLRKMEIVEHLNSLYIDFIKNANSTRTIPAKIVLADMPINEYINSLVVSQPLTRLKETLRLCNFITLMEKTNYSHNTIFKTGCPTCNKDLFYSEQNQHLKKSPEAYLEVLTGDKKFLPVTQKVQYFGDRVYQTLLDNKQYKSVLVACGSFQLFDTVKIILENDNKQADFDGYDFMKYKDELKREFSKNHKEFLEKIALLEVLHEVIDNGCIRELTVKGKHRINIDQYIQYIDHYTNMLSFESISPNVKFVNNVDSNKVKNCVSDQLIFGLGEDKEYIEEQEQSEGFFSLFKTGKENEGDANHSTIVEDEPPKRSFEDLEKETQFIEEEIKKHEDKIKPQHYIDQIYNEDQLFLLKQIVDVINKKTLFTEDSREQQKVIQDNKKLAESQNNNSQQNQDNSSNNAEEGEKKNKIKFKKSVPRFSKNTDLSTQ